MQPFQGIVRGRARQPATQLGSKQSGLIVEANTIDWGIEVECFISDHECIMRIYRTGGSTGKHSRELINIVKNGEIKQ